MNIQSAIDYLEQEWEQPDGFFGRLRIGLYDPVGLERLIQILQSVEVDRSEVLERRFVELTWYIPLFMSWQRERVKEQGGDVNILDIATNRIIELLSEILGVP